MYVLAGTLNARLREWKPETAAQVRARVTEIIGLADQDVLDLMRSGSVEQDVLDILDEPPVQVRFGRLIDLYLNEGANTISRRDGS